MGVKISVNWLMLTIPVPSTVMGEATCVQDRVGKNWLLSKLRKQTELHF